MAEAGGKLLVDVLRKIQNGTVSCSPWHRGGDFTNIARQVTTTTQDERYVTVAPKITHETSRIHWEKHTAEAIDRLHRGFTHQVHTILFFSQISADKHLYSVPSGPSSSIQQRKSSPSIPSHLRLFLYPSINQKQ